MSHTESAKRRAALVSQLASLRAVSRARSTDSRRRAIAERTAQGIEEQIAALDSGAYTEREAYALNCFAGRKDGSVMSWANGELIGSNLCFRGTRNAREFENLKESKSGPRRIITPLVPASAKHVIKIEPTGAPTSDGKLRFGSVSTHYSTLAKMSQKIASRA